MAKNFLLITSTGKLLRRSFPCSNVLARTSLHLKNYRQFSAKSETSDKFWRAPSKEESDVIKPKPGRINPAELEKDLQKLSAQRTEIKRLLPERRARTAKIQLTFGSHYFEVDNAKLPGSIFALPDSVLLWSPTSWEEITPETLSIIEILKPRPSVVILGSGTIWKPLNKAAMQYLDKLNIEPEIMDTDTAIATFDILNNEERLVVAGLIPCFRVSTVPVIAKEKYVTKSGRSVDMESPFVEDYDIVELPKRTLNEILIANKKFKPY